ncbi:MAG TPA: hypothetical protein VGK94_03430 [Candidatus Polarisedimenticolia bacterium]|jgi:hypothetical protein
MHLRRHQARRRSQGLPTLERSASDIQDLLSGVPERADLERLFDRKVSLSQILRLAGKRVDHDRIAELLGSPDPSRDLKKLLES